MDITLTKKTLRTGKLVLPMKYVKGVCQPEDPQADIMRPVIPISDDTVLIVHIPGKEAERLALEYCRQEEKIPPIPPPSTPSLSKPLIDLSGL